MSATQVLLLVGLAWALIGVSAALVMGRRGHAPFAWLVLAAAFGPLVLPLAAWVARHERGGLFARLSPGRPGLGAVDVLVGIDGSPESEAALATVLDLHAARLGRLTLATVVDYDVELSADPSDEIALARAMLVRAASATGLHPESIMLTGSPAESLRKYAVAEGYELLAVGRRGRGASRALLGSVASTLARGADVPVLIV